MASASGVFVTLMQRLVRCSAQYLVGLHTVDAGPSVSILSLDAPVRKNRILEQRSQVGPESWDYPLTLERSTSEMILRLEYEGRTDFVTLVPAELAAIAEFGWGDPGESLFPPVVDRREFEAAVARVRAYGPASVS